MLENNLLNSIETIINNTGAFVYVVDLENYEVLYANEKCEREFGDIVGKICYKTLNSCSVCSVAEDTIPLSCPVNTIFERENKNSINKQNYFFNDCIVSWKDNKKVKVQVGIDITREKQLEEKILKLTHYDVLTNLANRVLLKESVELSMQKSSKTSFYNALLFINLDNFKIVNGKSGHNIGDKLLIKAANRIKKSIQKNDIISRFGGDEFVVLAKTSEKNRNIVIKKLENISQKILKSLNNLYIIDNQEFSVSASIGIKLFNDDNIPVDELILHADNAMRNAKENGRNTFCFFDPKLQQIMEYKIKLSDSLKKAIKDNCISLHYQTQIFSDKKEEIIGVEALIRWIHPTKGLISPADFIPIAEESGLIVPLGEWILCESIKQLKIWKKDKIKKHWRISINVSSKQLEQDNFTSVIKNIIKKNKINPNMLRLELTESLLIQNTSKVLDRLYELKDMGLSLSIDDFGTGYSSLSYLKKLPIDELKIDQSFIRDLTIDTNDEIITQTIISIGKKFGLDVIAEGVETQEQYEKLLLMGCQYFQGYLFSKPVSIEHL